ncbi:hypothetical protein BCR39DRAFT_280931 [Naematelia encephala]|uniref:F-box domain-containing protein n=1 Tax=Naematelia encephala TaxID=71784 RepID=A0A1Y2ATF6_9TREE|nr:hypothetical protein BCR39DRAFT_280931 [Naematelia encephala]
MQSAGSSSDSSTITGTADVIPLSHLEALPDDILANIFDRLSIPELVVFERLSRTLGRRVNELGVPSYLRRNPHSNITLSPSATTWPPHQLLRHHHIIDRSLRTRRYHALQIGPKWPQAVIPCLSVSSSRVIYGAGGRLIVHPLEGSNTNRYGGKSVCQSQEYTIARPHTGSRADIIGLAELGNDQLAVAQFDGTLQRFDGSMRSIAHYPHPKGANVHTFATRSNGDLMMTTTSTGIVSLFRTKSPWQPPETFQLGHSRAWSSCIPTSIDALLVGVNGSINLHALLPSGPCTTPTRSLIGPDLPSKSSPYDIQPAPPDSIHSPSILLSAWYDSHLRLHDIRLPSSSPVATFSDPWSWADGSAMYSTTFLASHHIAGGGARHGVVALFDLRQPNDGWSVFSPGGKGSPVYKLVGEGGRIWGVTERRGFLLALDGSGDHHQGMVRNGARSIDGNQTNHNPSARERVSGWKGRGGKWGWTVRYGEDEGEGVVGYEHGRRFQSHAGGVMGTGGVQLLESAKVI